MRVRVGGVRVWVGVVEGGGEGWDWGEVFGGDYGVVGDVGA